MNASKKQLWWISLALFAALCMSSIPVRAGDHWLSRNTETKPAPKALYSQSLVSKTTADSAVTFDIVISLYTNRTTVAERAPYEAIINYFAQALYEESNGAHKLGTVSIYGKRKHATSCDILWEALGHPCGSAAGSSAAARRHLEHSRSASNSKPGLLSLDQMESAPRPRFRRHGCLTLGSTA